MPRRHTRTLAILSHRGVDTLRTGAAIALWPGWRHAYTRSEFACDTRQRRGYVTAFGAVRGRGWTEAGARSRSKAAFATAATFLRCYPLLSTIHAVIQHIYHIPYIHANNWFDLLTFNLFLLYSFLYVILSKLSCEFLFQSFTPMDATRFKIKIRKHKRLTQYGQWPTITIIIDIIIERVKMKSQSSL